MGLNIHVEEYIDGKLNSKYDGAWWDSIRHVGDRDFIYVLCADLDKTYMPDDATMGDITWRPASADAFTYLNVHIDLLEICEPNKLRLHELVNKMMANPNLYLSWND